MSKTQDAKSNGQAAAGESLKDVAENKISSMSEKDALGDKSLDDVSGGSSGRPFSTFKGG
jgi:hypothetical protein